MITLDCPSITTPRTIRRIHASARRTSKSTSGRPARTASTASGNTRSAANAQPSSRATASLRVKPRRFRVRNLIRSTVMVGVGVVIGACSIWHPHAVAGRLEGHRASAAAIQAKVSNPNRSVGKTIGRVRTSGLWTAVEPGDTVWSLADRYGSPDRPIRDTVQDILRWNHLHDDASLQVGRSIQVGE